MPRARQPKRAPSRLKATRTVCPRCGASSKSLAMENPRLPYSRVRQAGPCECDIYLTCPKFLTTPKYAPRLRERLCMEQTLAADAETRGWVREVERHERTADRIRSLLLDLGEPVETDCP